MSPFSMREGSKVNELLITNRIGKWLKISEKIGTSFLNSPYVSYYHAWPSQKCHMGPNSRKPAAES